MLKKDIVERISEGTGLPMYLVDEVIDAFQSVVTQAIVDGEEINLINFMKIYTFKGGERVVRNMHSNESYHYPSVRRIKVDVSKKIKDMVKKYEI